jgi:hypothetical protein
VREHRRSYHTTAASFQGIAASWPAGTTVENTRSRPACHTREPPSLTPIRVEAQTNFGASLAPDRMAVAIGGGNGIAIWDFDPDHLADAACGLAGRNLTPTE